MFRGSRSFFSLELLFLAVLTICLSKDTVTMANYTNAFALPNHFTFYLNLTSWRACQPGQLLQLLADCDLEIVTMHEFN